MARLAGAVPFRARRRLVVVTALALAALAASGAVARPILDQERGASEARTSTVVVYMKKPLQVMQGFGSSERVWSDPHLSQQGVAKSVVPPDAQTAILTALYRRLGLTRVRVVLDPGIQPVRAAPFNFKGKLGEDQIAFINQAKAFGLQTFFPGPVYLENWMTPADTDAYVDYAMGVLRYWRSNGLEPPLYAPLNEPKIARNFPPSWMRTVVVRLGRRLKAEGFNTKLVVPDDVNPIEAYRRADAVLQDPEARQYVGALAYHIYGGDEDDWARFRLLAAGYRLPIWMTEWNNGDYDRWPQAGEWALRIHKLITIGGVSAIDYLWGFFGDWRQGESYVPIRFERGVYQSHSLTPAYYLTGQWSRFVRPGYRRVTASPEDDAVLTTAFTGPRKLVVVALNVSAGSQRVRFAVRGGRVTGKVAGVRTSPAERWRTLEPVPVRPGGFATALPPSSVTTFVVRRR